MPTQSQRTNQVTLTNTPNLLGKIGIKIIKIISNLFWEVIDTITYRSPKLAEFYDKVIEKEYQAEYENYNIETDKKVLHIGCGPYPLTELVLVKYFNAKVIGIDNNLKAVQMARDVVKKRNLEKKVTILPGDGTNYPMGDFDVIIVSSCAIPKTTIMENIIHHAKKNCLIIIREIDIALAEIYKKIEIHKNTILLETTHHHPLPFILLIPWTAISMRIK